jgi:hypothetical protein
VDPATGQRYWLDAQGQWQAADGTPVSGGAPGIRGCGDVLLRLPGALLVGGTLSQQGTTWLVLCGVLQHVAPAHPITCLPTCLHLCLHAGPFAKSFALFYPPHLPGLPLQDWRYLWVELWSREAQRPYYFHQASKQTSWERPPDLGALTFQWRLLLPLPEVMLPVVRLRSCSGAGAQGSVEVINAGVW